MMIHPGGDLMKALLLFIFLIASTPVLAEDKEYDLFMELARLEIAETYCKLSVDPKIKKQIKFEILTSVPGVTSELVEEKILMIKQGVLVSALLPKFPSMRRICERLVGREV